MSATAEKNDVPHSESDPTDDIQCPDRYLHASFSILINALAHS